MIRIARLVCLVVLCASAAGCGGTEKKSSCGVRAISVGANHSCVVTASHGVRCWGSNVNGQLGDGTTSDRSTPSAADVLTDVVALAAGNAHTCALTSAGGVRCWGFNGDGQLGDGTTDARLTPPTRDVMTDVRAIAAGASHTCALTTAGGVRCWGRNQAGQLGEGTTDARFAAASSDVLVGVKQITAGGSHTCALMASGGVRCWGLNVFGQLGGGTMDDQQVRPPDSDAITGVSMVSAGDAHTCVVLDSGGVRCWGRNADGELGDGTYNSMSTPPLGDVVTGAQAVAAGLNFTCALVRTNGGVRCWGYNSDGQLGDDTELNVDRLVPAATDVLTGARAIAVGFGNTCAIMSTGGIRCWGVNANGQLGNRRAPDPSMFPPTTDIEGLPSACP